MSSAENDQQEKITPKMYDGGKNTLRNGTSLACSLPDKRNPTDQPKMYPLHSEWSCTQNIPKTPIFC